MPHIWEATTCVFKYQVFYFAPEFVTPRLILDSHVLGA